MRTLLALCCTLSLLSSCRYMSLGPYKHYRISNDEAVPACQMRNAIYQSKQ